MGFIGRWFTPSKSDHQSGAQYNDMLNAMHTPDTVVDPSAAAGTNNLGRAALIQTSPQGVQGTDPSLRYKLLGN